MSSAFLRDGNDRTDKNAAKAKIFSNRGVLVEDEEQRTLLVEEGKRIIRGLGGYHIDPENEKRDPKAPIFS